MNLLPMYAPGSFVGWDCICIWAPSTRLRPAGWLLNSSCRCFPVTDDREYFLSNRCIIRGEGSEDSIAASAALVAAASAIRLGMPAGWAL